MLLSGMLWRCSGAQRFANGKSSPSVLVGVGGDRRPIWIERRRRLHRITVVENDAAWQAKTEARRAKGNVRRVEGDGDHPFDRLVAGAYVARAESMEGQYGYDQSDRQDGSGRWKFDQHRYSVE